MNFKNIGLLLLILFFGLSCQFVNSFMLKSGIEYKIKVEPKNKENKELIKNAASILENRFSSIDIPAEAKVSNNPKEPNIVYVKVYGKQNQNLVKKILLYEADLLLMKVDSPPNPNLSTYPTKEAAGEELQKLRTTNRKIYEYVEKGETPSWIIVETPPIITGLDIRDASAVESLYDKNGYQISFSLKPDGAKTFGEWTNKNISNYMAVILNDKVVSVAFIQSQIFDQGQISGNFTKEQAEDVALALKSGYLPAKLTLLEEKPFETDPE